MKSWNCFGVRDHLNRDWCRRFIFALSLSLKISKAEKLPCVLLSNPNLYEHLVGHKLLLKYAKLTGILQGNFKAKMLLWLQNFQINEEINTFCHTVQKQSVQGSLSRCRFKLFFMQQQLGASVSFRFQKVLAPRCWKHFFLPGSWGSHCH